MTVKIRAGLYECTYVIGRSTTITYTIEKNTGDWEQFPVGKWIVMTSINEVGKLPERNCLDRFNTKRQAAREINCIQKCGFWEKTENLGWCYKEQIKCMY